MKINNNDVVIDINEIEDENILKQEKQKLQDKVDSLIRTSIGFLTIEDYREWFESNSFECNHTDDEIEDACEHALKYTENDYIQQYDIIGYIPESSKNKSRLHFEIWGNNVKLNPEKWLKKK